MILIQISEEVTAMQELYTPGYSSNAMNFMAKRSLETHAAFFQPYLRPGMIVVVAQERSLWV
jgi:hypothetical protein